MGEYLGNCQCKAVRFRIVSDLLNPGRCNCSYCRRAWNAGHYVETGDFERRYGTDGYGVSVYIRDPEGNEVELKSSPQTEDTTQSE